jgi:hypothetical protein
MSKTVLFALVICLCAAAVAQQKEPVTPQQAKIIREESGAWKPQQARIIETYEREVAEAEKKHDWAAIARHLAPDFLEIAADGKTYSKQQAAENFKNVELNSYTMSKIEVRPLNPSAAVIAYKIEVNADFKGQPMSGAYRVSSAWARVGGAWLMVVHQVTPVPK